MKNKIKLQSGQTLVEVILSLGIFAIVVVALVTLATSSLRNTQESVRRSEAPKIANAGVEAVLFYKSVNGITWAAFPDTDNETCYFRLTANALGTSLSPIFPPTLPQHCYASDTNPAGSWVLVVSYNGLTYQRQIKVQRTTASNYLVTSTVRWTDTQGIRTVVIPRRMTNWR